MTNASREVNSQEGESLIKEYLESGLSAARWCQDKGAPDVEKIMIVMLRELRENDR